AEEWFRREEQLGQKLGKGSLWERVQPDNQTPILKIGEDMRTGKL
ncbi:MAG: NmrA family protein, partial [Mycobacterium sp.]